MSLWVGWYNVIQMAIASFFQRTFTDFDTTGFNQKIEHMDDEITVDGAVRLVTMLFVQSVNLGVQFSR